MKCHLAKLALLIRKRHIAFDCRNYTAMDESILSTADEIEPSAIEEIAGVPNADKNMSVCSCRGMCLREKGRNACHVEKQDSFALLFATQTALRVGIGATKVIQIIQVKHLKVKHRYVRFENM
jgi:hypothetical protein